MSGAKSCQPWPKLCHRYIIIETGLNRIPTILYITDKHKNDATKTFLIVRINTCISFFLTTYSL